MRPSKDANQAERKIALEINAMLRDVFREVFGRMKWAREKCDPEEEKFWLHMVIFYCEYRLERLKKSKTQAAESRR